MVSTVAQVPAVVQVLSLAQELPHAMAAAGGKKKKKKKKKPSYYFNLSSHCSPQDQSLTYQDAIG